jgi:hypothetical protein
MDDAAVELLAEATDVIGSQSRQEAARIKQNRYAFAPDTTQIAYFPLRDEHGTRFS